MKKFSFKASVSIIFILLSVFVCFSCGNFMSGNLLKNEIDDSIEYENSPVVKIRVSADENTGTFNSGSGEHNLKITDSLLVSFTQHKDYKFEKWVAVQKKDETVSMEKYVKFDNPTTAETKFTLIKTTNEEILIKPLCSILTSYIDVDSQYGKTSPSGKSICRTGETISINFIPDSDYQFIKWTVTPKADVDGNKPVFGSEENSETTFTLPAKLAEKTAFKIVPECVKKPKIVSATPGYDASGVYRDRTIVLFFDKAIEKSSIYWTGDELEELLGEELLEEELLEEVNTANYILKKAKGKTDSDGKQYYYKYTSKSDSDDVHFKNITITKVENENENLLKYYGMPFLDDDNPRFLRIPVFAENLPPAAVNILVTISKNVGTKTESIESLITLKEDYSFAYRTNGSTDKEAPIFKKGAVGDDFFVGRAKYENGKYSLRAQESILESVTENGVDKGLTELNDAKNLKKNNLFNKYALTDEQRTIEETNDNLYVYGTIEDGGSGPASLQWSLTKIENNFYPLSVVGSTKLIEGSIANMSVNGPTVTIDECITLTGLGLTEGVYKITFYASDLNGNVAERIYYFVWDNVGPKIVDKITEIREGSGNSKVSWGVSDSQDVVNIGITPFLNNKTEGSEKTVDYYTGGSVSFTGLTDFQAYNYKVTLQDYVGNESVEICSEVTRTKVSIPSTVTCVKTYAKDSIRVKVKHNDIKCGKTEIQSTVFTNNGERDLSNLGESSSIHTITFRDYDYSGNYSESTVTLNAVPSVGMIVYSDMYWSPASVSGKTPVGVICEASDPKNIYIFDVTEVTGKKWCNDEYNQISGDNYLTANYKNIKYGYSEQINFSTGLEWLNCINEKTDKFTISEGDIFYYVKNKDSCSNEVKWFIPSFAEFVYVFDNIETLNNSFSTINKTEFSKNEPYWTSTPAKLRKSSMGSTQISQNALVVTVGEDELSYNGTFYRFKTNYNNAEVLYVSNMAPSGTGSSDNNQYQYWIKNATKSVWGNHDIITRAMGLVDLSK